MGRKYHIISGDGHLETPPDFVKFVPEKFKDRAPRLITLPDGGGDAWLMEGMPLTYASQNLKGRGVVKFAGQSYFDDDGTRAEGAGDGIQRLQRAGRGRHRRRDPVRAGVREPLPREDPRTRRVHVDGAGVQHVAGRGLLHAGTRPADRQRAHPRQRHRRRDQRAGTRARSRASRRCSWCSSRTAAAGPKPEDDRFWEKSLELDMALSPHFSFGGPINIGGARHDTSQWPAEAGMTQHAQGPPVATRWRR